jgi:hypothetical protein
MDLAGLFSLWPKADDQTKDTDWLRGWLHSAVALAREEVVHDADRDALAAHFDSLTPQKSQRLSGLPTLLSLDLS